MYRYQHEIFRKEKIYIAGPECFYTYGYDALAAMKCRAESLGFGVTLPNDHPLDMDNPDLQKRADSIFHDLEQVMNETTVIIADLEAFRGAEPDSGTVFELGMAYAKGARCYGYTRDKRSLAAKNQRGELRGGAVYDERGNIMPYSRLPFAPSVIGSTKIVEGDFDDCLKMLMIDLEEEEKHKGFQRGTVTGREQKAAEAEQVGTPGKDSPVVFLSGFERYEENGREILESMKEMCESYGFQASSPLDWDKGVERIHTDNPYIWAANLLDNCQNQIRNCDLIIANLNDYRGYEICNDVGFECGLGFQLGKKLYGYMDNPVRMIDRVPHLGEEMEYRDHTGSNVENFDYPVNLMFASSMKILKGKLKDVLEEAARDFQLGNR